MILSFVLAEGTIGVAVAGAEGSVAAVGGGVSTVVVSFSTVGELSELELDEAAKTEATSVPLGPMIASKLSTAADSPT
jgi:hypothetical protein